MSSLRKNIFIWLSGADPTALASSTISEHRKYIKLGMVILIPAIMSWIGMWFAAPYIGFNGNERILISTVWSAIILTIDTYLVTSLDKRFALQNRKRYNSLAFFRIVISIFLGIIISHPLVLRILEPNILEEIENMKKEDIFKTMTVNRDSATAWNKSNFKELDSVNAALLCKGILLKAEGNGIKIVTECGSSSGFRDRAFRYERFLTEIDSLEKYRNRLNLSIAGINQKFRDKTTEDLNILQKTFSYDYLKRTIALKRLGKKESHARLLVWMLLIFFILVDSIAVMSKVITPIGEHERILTSQEDLMRDNAVFSNAQKSNSYLTALDLERQYKENMIRAIYRRAPHHTPGDIKAAVENILNNTIADQSPSQTIDPRIKSQIISQYVFLFGASILGLVLWYVLKISLLKDSPNFLAMAMSAYFTIISVVAARLK